MHDEVETRTKSAGLTAGQRVKPRRRGAAFVVDDEPLFLGSLTKELGGWHFPQGHYLGTENGPHRGPSGC